MLALRVRSAMCSRNSFSLRFRHLQASVMASGPQGLAIRERRMRRKVPQEATPRNSIREVLGLFAFDGLTVGSRVVGLKEVDAFQ